MLQTLAQLYARDLDKLHEEIELFADEKSLWKISGDIKNPSGNLALHLCGNLQHFIGNFLGGVDYVRKRDYEFSARDVARAELLSEIQKTKKVVVKTLEEMSPLLLEQEYPVVVFKDPMTVEYFLFHLLAHLNYHTGQINYHRRILGKN